MGAFLSSIFVFTLNLFYDSHPTTPARKAVGLCLKKEGFFYKNYF